MFRHSACNLGLMDKDVLEEVLSLYFEWTGILLVVLGESQWIVLLCNIFLIMGPFPGLVVISLW